MTDREFGVVYWGDDQSTEVQFRPVTTQPPLDLITACMVFATTDTGHIAMSKPARGWGLVGGHREPGESPEDCARREAREEAAIELGDLELIGHWATKKVFESDANRHYPPLGYQLLYRATISRIDEFIPMLEVSDRVFVSPWDVANYHHNFGNFEEVMKYIQRVDDVSRLEILDRSRIRKRILLK
jgi:8-oxo-dGTP pyrophosphatase MutT (NUDIX family)